MRGEELTVRGCAVVLHVCCLLSDLHRVFHSAMLFQREKEKEKEKKKKEGRGGERKTREKGDLYGLTSPRILYENWQNQAMEGHVETHSFVVSAYRLFPGFNLS